MKITDKQILALFVILSETLNSGIPFYDHELRVILFNEILTQQSAEIIEDE